MNNNINKILTAIVALISVIGFVLFIMVFRAEESELAGAVGPIVGFSTWLLYAAIAITIVFAVINIFKNPEDLKKIGINVGVLLAIYLVAYLTASDAAVLDVQGNILEGGEAGSTSKLISTIINYSEYLGAIALGAVGFGAVRNALK